MSFDLRAKKAYVAEHPSKKYGNSNKTTNFLVKVKLNAMKVSFNSQGTDIVLEMDYAKYLFKKEYRYVNVILFSFS